MFLYDGWMNLPFCISYCKFLDYILLNCWRLSYICNLDKIFHFRSNTYRWILEVYRALADDSKMKAPCFTTRLCCESAVCASVLIEHLFEVTQTSSWHQSFLVQIHYQQDLAL